MDGKHFENGAFRERCSRDNQVISPPEVSGVVLTENISCVFREKCPFSNSFNEVWTRSYKMLLLILAEQLGVRSSRRPRKTLQGRERRIGGGL